MNMVLTKMQLRIDPVTGTPLSKSTLSMILKNRQHHLNIDLNARDNWKKKARRQQFPVLESYISEWVYQAQLARVVTSDDVILAVARKFVDEITSAKNILPHVLHTYLPVSPGNTISPYTPHASHFSVLF